MNRNFWNSRPSTVSGMMLLSDVSTLDEAERRDILAQLPSLEGMDVLDLEFEDGSFDFAFMNWLLMYLDDRQITLLRDRIRRWTRVGGYVFFRESCSVGSTGTAPSKDNPTRYRSDDEYTRLFQKDFSLLHRGNVKIYDELFNNPHQHYWLFQR